MADEYSILIQQCQKNDRKAQQKLYDTFSGLVFGICRRYFTDYDDAQECFQEIFIAAFTKINQFQQKGSFEGWLRRIAVNTCLNKLRTQTFYVLTDEFVDDKVEEDIFEKDLSDDYSAEELIKLIQQLPERYRTVFNLYVVEEYQHKEIAEMLNITIGTSKSNLSRAKEWLQKNIKKKTLLKDNQPYNCYLSIN